MLGACLSDRSDGGYSLLKARWNVSVQGLEFSVSVGFDGLPWFSHGWDTFSGDNSDYAFRADGSTTTFTLPYAPEQDVKVNVYFDSVRQDPTNNHLV